MKTLDNKYIVYNADDEEPSCQFCEFYDRCDGESCGPEYGWSRYRRSIKIDDKNQVLKELIYGVFRS